MDRWEEVSTESLRRSGEQNPHPRTQREREWGEEIQPRKDENMDSDKERGIRQTKRDKERDRRKREETKKIK